MPEQKRYIAFISYSRKNKDVAEWLHKKLESYILPKEDSIKNIFDFKSKYFRPVFLDTQDLHVEERPFTDEIRESLRNSAYLIVLCSRSSAISPFVKLEIDYFLLTHDNNLSRVVPLFIDEVSGSIPSSFDGTSIMERHFPIFNSRLSFKSEANNYCFYQIVSYILGIDFSNIYNRYEIQSAKEMKEKRRNLGLLSLFLGVFLVILMGYHFQFKLKSEELIKSKQRHIMMEKTVFPAAVVDGYEKNFLSPVIKHLKKSPNKFRIYILMPGNEKDLSHRDRVEDFEYNARLGNYIDSLFSIHLDTETKRGSRVIQISKNGKAIDNLYLDFATTTSSFLTVAKHKKSFREYETISIDSLIKEYSDEFICQMNKRLGRDSVYVRFFSNTSDLIREISVYE